MIYHIDLTPSNNQYIAEFLYKGKKYELIVSGEYLTVQTTRCRCFYILHNFHRFQFYRYDGTNDWFIVIEEKYIDEILK